MTTTPGNANSNLAGKPPVVEPATGRRRARSCWSARRRTPVEGDAIATARRRLPMVELDGAVEVTGADGPVPFLDLFQGRNELVVYQHMSRRRAAPRAVRGLYHNGLAHEGRRLSQRSRRLVRRPDLGPVGRGARYVEFMGYTQPWYSVRAWRRRSAEKWGTSSASCTTATLFLRIRRRPWQRTGQPVLGPARHDALRPSRGVEDNPEGWPEAPQAGAPVGGHGSPICWYWRTDADGVATWGPTGRPVPQWTRPGATPVETLGRRAATTDAGSVGLDVHNRTFAQVAGHADQHERALPAVRPTLGGCADQGPSRAAGPGGARGTQRSVEHAVGVRRVVRSGRPRAPAAASAAAVASSPRARSDKIHTATVTSSWTGRRGTRWGRQR